ncbi:zinc finger MYM-type protein 1-like [Metopolophium dirhodum]|uniref:zinc finger MYM-type protein 1-like n=1 Tax=Metopolophium dirhodum TaxID=44670 RepID=UPI00299030BA|nr:zinc finger MYM-type protein 1-like [Metopolophium dirhodum]
MENVLQIKKRRRKYLSKKHKGNVDKLKKWRKSLKTDSDTEEINNLSTSEYHPNTIDDTIITETNNAQMVNDHSMVQYFYPLSPETSTSIFEPIFNVSTVVSENGSTSRIDDDSMIQDFYPLSPETSKNIFEPTFSLSTVISENDSTSSCKLFSSENPHLNHLSTIGTNDWKHLPEKLITHERSVQHFKSIEAWTEFKKRILKEKFINQQHLSIIEKEKIHWTNVLNRILSVIHYLAAHNDAFRGSSDVLYTKSNGKFLGLIEMLAKFDPVIMVHVYRIQNKETHVHYQGHRIQDEIINMMANEIKQKIIRNIQSAKYLTIIMDCTPDIEHSEQLAILLRIVHMDEENEYSTPTIQEYSLDFITVDSTTGLNLSDVLMKQLKLYKINIENCRGQAYDNGSNITGRYQGVQTQILNINPRAFFTPCAAHNLNLV